MSFIFKKNNYFKKKVKNAYKMYKKGLSRKKVYGVVEKDGLFAVISLNKGKYKYMLAGGSVEKRETNEVAIIREVREELNINAKIIKSLGTIRYKATFEYKGEKFDVDNEAEIFYLEYISNIDKKTHGIKGEFTDENKINYITHDEMLENVEEFKSFGIKL